MKTWEGLEMHPYEEEFRAWVTTGEPLLYISVNGETIAVPAEKLQQLVVLCREAISYLPHP